MNYLFEKWDSLNSKLKAKYIFLFLDYDGTLTPIVETPEKASMPQDTNVLLEELSKNSKYQIAIISGRSLKDIKEKIGLKNIIYVGNHGLEIEGPKIKFSRLPFDIRRDPALAGASHVSPRLKSIMHNIAQELTKRLSNIKGVLVEDKGLTLSIHYRLVDKKDMPCFERIFSEATNPYTVRDKIKINHGKKVYEIKPPVQWDKGKVVLWLMARQQFASGGNNILPVYIGDDVTDEDAFKVLRKKGITIFVGKPKRSNAQYYLKHTQEVKDFLNHIVQLQ